MTVKLQSDSGVYVEGEGYERVRIYQGWNPDDLTMLGQVHLRIDRMPSQSFANGSVWNGHEWVILSRTHSNEFWDAMPAWTRARQRRADERTEVFCQQILANLVELALAGSL